MEFGPNELTVHRRSQRNPDTDTLVNSMLAEDAYRYASPRYAAMPPRDSGIPEMSVMETAHMIPEEHAILSDYSRKKASDRQLESENQPLIPDYPEDYVAGGAGLFQLGKGLTKAGLRYIAKQQARKHRLGYTRNVLRPQAQFERKVRHNDMGSGWGNENFKNIHARRRDPSTLRKASKKYRDEGELAEDVYGDPINDAEAMYDIDQDFHLYATREEMDLLEGTDALGKVMGRDRSVHDWIDDIEWPRIKAGLGKKERELRKHGLTSKGMGSGVKGGHEGYSELPKYMTRDELWELFRRGGPRPSANSIIPAAVLMESMTE